MAGSAGLGSAGDAGVSWAFAGLDHREFVPFEMTSRLLGLVESSGLSTRSSKVSTERQAPAFRSCFFKLLIEILAPYL